ncbi:family 1 encapsulin nanocompartment shell protein [Aminiphilus sp.]|uniref:family 1 encapsulin nanocompartment shell protein n=1 Tax=Aminiphilus sp. TaxID=1872488 RepID=UPI00261ABEEA|nr:family 1 encapsulin nanocompartment shell protein [Aminiphilus sp.]
MDILKRSLSPVTDGAWKEIDAQARTVLEAHLSARRFVDVEGPRGWDYAALTLGRLDVPKGQKPEGVVYGVHQVQPLVETRVAFELDRWELDNVERGAKDIDFSALDEAAKKAALFEEKAVYEGLKAAGIVGLAEAGKGNAVSLDMKSKETILGALIKGLGKFQDAAVGGPYALVAGPSLWNAIHSFGDYPLHLRIKDLLGGKIILLPHTDAAYLVSLRGGDMELVLGQDFAVGFEDVAAKKVQLFLTESFTFRVIVPEAVVPLTK